MSADGSPREGRGHYLPAQGRPLVRRRVRALAQWRREADVRLRSHPRGCTCEVDRTPEKRRRNVPVIPRSLTLGDYLDYWITQVVRPVARWNTYKKYEQTVRLYLQPGLGRKPLSRVRVADVQAFLNKQVQAGHSIAKVQIMRTVLGAAFTRAMREELVFMNPARLATLPTAPTSRSRPWSADEARQFLSVARNDPLYSAFLLLLVYGLRRGEVLGLAWEDVDLADDMLRVGWQLQRIDGQLARVPVKTAAGRRVLP